MNPAEEPTEEEINQIIKSLPVTLDLGWGSRVGLPREELHRKLRELAAALWRGEQKRARPTPTVEEMQGILKPSPAEARVAYLSDLSLKLLRALRLPGDRDDTPIIRQAAGVEERHGYDVAVVWLALWHQLNPQKEEVKN